MGTRTLKVYIVELSRAYDSDILQDIFTTVEAAQNYADEEIIQRYPTDPQIILEPWKFYQPDTWSKRVEKDLEYVITEYPVREK